MIGWRLAMNDVQIRKSAMVSAKEIRETPRLRTGNPRARTRTRERRNVQTGRGREAESHHQSIQAVKLGVYGARLTKDLIMSNMLPLPLGDFHC